MVSVAAGAYGRHGALELSEAGAPVQQVPSEQGDLVCVGRGRVHDAPPHQLVPVDRRHPASVAPRRLRPGGVRGGTVGVTTFG